MESNRIPSTLISINYETEEILTRWMILESVEDFAALCNALKELQHNYPDHDHKMHIKDEYAPVVSKWKSQLWLGLTLGALGEPKQTSDT